MINKRLTALRGQMVAAGIDIYLIPTSDFHNSEYVGAYFKVRAYMSGFTGSAGTLLVTATESGLWTDGRYFLQAEDQLAPTEITLYKSGNEGVPTIDDYLKKHLAPGLTLGFDGRVFPSAAGKHYLDLAHSLGAAITTDIDLVDKIWEDRPALSSMPISILDTKYSGLAASDKLTNIRAKMHELSCNTHIISSLDNIAWILNLRGKDVNCNPVFLSYLLITEEDALLFVNPKSVSDEVAAYLTSLNIKQLPYNDIYTYARSLPENSSILVDENSLNYALYNLLASYKTVNAENPSNMMKACKNETEVKNLRETNIKDGVAMVKFLYWLDTNIGTTRITELSASDRLEAFRALQDEFEGISFETIAGYNAHGAIIHYEPTPETDAELKPEGLLLVDSGAQFLGGTTDITRTIALGPVTEEMRHHYTMVLKGHLRLSAAVFPYGCSGANLDILARAPFWNEHQDYNHGTGHGLGYFLNVHEGPHNLNWRTSRKSTCIPFEEGMIVTDEPGIYIAGKYGIRIEGDLLCRKDTKNEYGQFMKFEMLTLCPIDTRPVNVNELDDTELGLLNSYHQTVKEKLLPYLDGAEAQWLIKATEALVR